jgi:hypothetical protein
MEKKKGFLDGVRSLIFVSDPQKKKKQKELGILRWIPEIHQMSDCSLLPPRFFFFLFPFPTAFVFCFPYSIPVMIVYYDKLSLNTVHLFYFSSLPSCRIVHMMNFCL